MKRAVLVLALALPACNDSDLSRNSIPPIAGIVGGPDQPAGNGNVAMELATSPTIVAGGSSLKITNESRAVEPVILTVAGELTYAQIRADVGDILHVQWEQAGTGALPTDEFFVQPPQVTRVSIAGTTDALGFVRLGSDVVVEGSGFAHTALGTIIKFDGVPHDFAFHGDIRPGVFTFALSTSSGLVPNTTYKLSVHVAGGEPSELYLSNEYSVEVLPPL